MTDKDRVIHEAMGLCWHDAERMWNGAGNPFYTCKKCDADILVRYYYDPDYSKDLRPVFEWMRGKGESKAFQEFIFMTEDFKFSEYYWINTFSYWMSRTPGQQRDLIAQWIESTRDRM